MKHFLLIGVNAKYIHSNLAIRYMSTLAYSMDIPIDFLEFSINDTIDNIIRDIVYSDADIFAFSCYIWNIEIISKIASSLKKINPNSTIILGGPEVSFDTTMSDTNIDIIINGEGELTFIDLYKNIVNDGDLSSVNGITYRHLADVSSTPERPLIDNLDILPMPYRDFIGLENKIIYYETSRGCPFNCKYCLSSTIKGVRSFSMERIKTDIKTFVDNNIKQVKLVDRTFNYNKSRAIDILNYIISLNGNTNFHFEISADIVDDAFIDAIATSPKDTFQLEIGVQSTHIPTLNSVNRHAYLPSIYDPIKRLIATGKVHVHLDLIAGLPYEDINLFEKSFNETIAMRPQMLQLGFLKLLKGSELRFEAIEHEYIYNDFSPYEVLGNKYLSYTDILKLKDIESLLEIYYNSQKFNESIKYILKQHGSNSYKFFKDFAIYINKHSITVSNIGMSKLYEYLWDFARSISDIEQDKLTATMQYDFIYNNINIPMPTYLDTNSRYNEKIKLLINDICFIKSHLPEYQNASMREINKKLRYYLIEDQIHFFIKENPIRVIKVKIKFSSIL